MQWPNPVSAFILFVLALFIAGTNMWLTAARSTIPLVLDSMVVGKEVRSEKHQGKDDVYLLEIEGLGQLQVDRPIYECVAVGESLQKDQYSRELRHGEQVLTLRWSSDYQGMLTAMPICLGIFAVLLVAAMRGLPPIPETIRPKKKHSTAETL